MESIGEGMEARMERMESSMDAMNKQMQSGQSAVQNLLSELQVCTHCIFMYHSIIMLVGAWPRAELSTSIHAA